MHYFWLSLITAIALCNGQKAPHWWKGRNTIVHLFEWKWRDIGDECEGFLQHKGYAGVQISPPNENVIATNRPWWERYQPISYKLETRSGSEDDFLNMTTRCNAVGVRIYADIIINHMAAPSQIVIGTGGNTANPANKEYPSVPYSPEDFDDKCVDNGHNGAKNCGVLPHLIQSNEWVRTKIIEFCNHLINLGVAGFRVDGAEYMKASDLEYIFNNVKNLNADFGFTPGSRPFIYQEITSTDDKVASQYVNIGVVTEFRYSQKIGTVFKGNDKLTFLRSWGAGWGFLESHNALVFVDNHVNQRAQGPNSNNILTYKNAKQYKMATAFMLAFPYGIARVMSSFAFDNYNQGPPQDEKEYIKSPTINPDDTCGNGWVCEHRWREIYNMIGFKHVVRGTNVTNWWSNNDQQIAFSRGEKGFIAFTNWGDLKQTLQTYLPGGVYCDIISGEIDENGRCTGKTVEVGQDGKAYIQLLAHEFDGVLAIHVQAMQRSLNDL